MEAEPTGVSHVSESSAAAGAEAPGSPSGEPSSKMKFDGSMSGLKEFDEDLYNMMVESWAMDICNDWKKRQDEAKKRRKEQERWTYND